VLIAVFAVALALVEAFLVPLRIGTVPLPVCVPLAMAGNIVLATLAARRTGSIAWAAAPPVLWLLVVIVLSLPRAEGDLIVPGTLTGLVFLFAGAIAGAYGVASEITRRAGAAARTRR
jgi:threonine/homoserine efflux transporter RhtA